MMVPQIVVFVLAVLVVLVLVVGAVVAWLDYRPWLAAWWRQAVVRRFRNLRERVNRWLEPRLHQYFEGQLGKQAKTYQDGDIFRYAARARWLWLHKERVFQTAILRRIDMSEVWFVELVTNYGNEMVRSTGGNLFYTRETAEDIARSAVMGDLGSRQAHFGSTSGYGVHWIYHREQKRTPGFESQTFTMRHPAAPDGLLAYVSAGVLPAKGVVRKGAWVSYDQMAKNTSRVVNIDRLRDELNRAVSEQEQALAKD